MSTVIQASTEIDLEDAGVARGQPKDIKAKESDRELVARLVDQARAEGVELVGENGLLGRLTKLVLESALEGEITDHLGYDKHQRGASETGNSRNGARSKTVITDVGPVEISVPRDRDGSFEPKIVRKRQRRLSGIDEMVISLAAKGLTTGEISAHLAEVYGAQVSKETISTITDKVLDGMAEWQNRPLDPQAAIYRRNLQARHTPCRGSGTAVPGVHRRLGGQDRRMPTNREPFAPTASSLLYGETVAYE
jgi:hypothetical protein